MIILCGSRRHGPSAQIPARPSLSSETVTQTRAGSPTRCWASAASTDGLEAQRNRSEPCPPGVHGSAVETRHNNDRCPRSGGSVTPTTKPRRTGAASRGSCGPVARPRRPTRTRVPSARLSGPARPARLGPGARGGRRGWRDRPGGRPPPRAFPGFCSGAALSSGPLGRGGLRGRRATEHAQADRLERRARRGTCRGAGGAGGAGPAAGRTHGRGAAFQESLEVPPGSRARSPRPGRPGPRCPGRSAPSSACPSRAGSTRRSPAQPPVALAESAALPGAGPAAAGRQPRRAPPRYLPTWRPPAHAPRLFHGPAAGAGGGTPWGRGVKFRPASLGGLASFPRPGGSRTRPPPGPPEFSQQTLRAYRAQECFSC